MSIFNWRPESGYADAIEKRSLQHLVVGGSNLIRQFIQFGLVDELIVTIVPVILGDGQPFFESIEKEQPLHLKKCTRFIPMVWWN